MKKKKKTTTYLIVTYIPQNEFMFKMFKILLYKEIPSVLENVFSHITYLSSLLREYFTLECLVEVSLMNKFRILYYTSIISAGTKILDQL